jgi:hypothetical protein
VPQDENHPYIEEVHRELERGETIGGKEVPRHSHDEEPPRTLVE